MLGNIEGGRRRGWQGWDGWMASLTQWTGVWASSRSWWWIGKPGVLQSIGLQRVGHDWVTELNWCICLVFFPVLCNTHPQASVGSNSKYLLILAFRECCRSWVLALFHIPFTSWNSCWKGNPCWEMMFLWWRTRIRKLEPNHASCWEFLFNESKHLFTQFF